MRPIEGLGSWTEPLRADMVLPAVVSNPHRLPGFGTTVGATDSGVSEAPTSKAETAYVTPRLVSFLGFEGQR